LKWIVVYTITDIEADNKEEAIKIVKELGSEWGTYKALIDEG